MPSLVVAFSAASIGIGGMTGAGIFAILGLAATTTKGAVPIVAAMGSAGFLLASAEFT